MTDDNWRAYCEQCNDEFTFEQEDGAIGWMLGHSLRTDHYKTFKEEL